MAPQETLLKPRSPRGETKNPLSSPFDKSQQKKPEAIEEAQKIVEQVMQQPTGSTVFDRLEEGCHQSGEIGEMCAHIRDALRTS